MPGRVVALWGATDRKTAYSLVNREWAQRLTALGYRVLTNEQCSVDGPESADVVIHHDFEDPFGSVVPPPAGKFVAVRTWDFGPYPPAWVKKINAECDQLWVHTDWVREQAVVSGIDSARVRVIPHGLDAALYRPDGDGYPLQTDGRFKFLFVGAAVPRKGMDILIKAYAQAFTADDDVCLVIKDHTGDVFYTNLSCKEEIQAMQQDANAPDVVYIDSFLTREELAALYRVCDVAVFPYRAEGFAIPILEAMACGTPPIVPDFGACRDYCRADSAFMMPVKRICLPVGDRFAFNSLGFEETLDGVDFCETPAGTLAEFMIRAAGLGRAQLGAMVRAGVDTAHNEFTWDIALRKVVACLDELNDGATPVRFRRTG